MCLGVRFALLRMAPFRASALFWSIASQDRVNQVAVNWWLDSPLWDLPPQATE